MANQSTQVSKIDEKLNIVELQKLGISADKTTDTSGTVKYSVFFDPASFYSGSFLKEYLGVIQKTFKPLEPIIEFLKTEIPFVSDYQEVVNVINQDSNPNSISLLDIVGFAAETTDNKVDVKFINDILSFNQFINNLPVGGEKISLGNFTINSAGIVNNSGMIPNLSLPKPQLPSGFDIPLLTDPANTVFGILQGQTKQIFDYAAPEFKLNLKGFGYSVPVIGTLGVAVGGDFGIGIQLGFGFDTYGLQQGRKFENGFYIKDFQNLDEIKLSAKLRVGPAITVSAASLDATLGIGPGIGFGLNDPTPGDGSIRLNEIESLGFENLFGKPNLSLLTDLRADIKILGSPIAGIGTPEATLSLGQFPPTEKVLSYVKQIQDLNSGKAVARILKDTGKFIEEKADRFGNWTRETADQFGNFVEEEFKNGVTVLTRTWDKTGDFIEETFNNTGQRIGRLIKTGEKFVSTVFDGPKEVSETIWEGTKTIFNEGEKSIEWIDNNLSSIVTGGKKTLFNAAGDVIDGAENFIQKGGDFISSGGGFFLDGGGSSLPTLPPKPFRTNSISNGVIYRANGSFQLQTGIGADILEGTEADSYIDDNTIDNIREYQYDYEYDNVNVTGDVIFSGDGDDYVAGNGGGDFLLGEGGNDILDGGEGNDFILGGTGDDSLKGGLDNDNLYGEEGNDFIDGGFGVDNLYGEEGNDFIDGGTGNDILDGGDGNDSLDGGKDNDSLYGYNGADTLQGGEGNDELNGEAGDDLLFSDSGEDTINGGEGNDTISYKTSKNSSKIGISIALDGRYSAGNFDGIDNLDQIVNVENVIGSQYGDNIIGSSTFNSIYGEDGNDIIQGLKEDDFLKGGAGDDKLYGGEKDLPFSLSGNDFLEGGVGADLIDGGDGKDVASYEQSEEKVSVNLLTGKGSMGEAEGDTLVGIEELYGSRHNDTLVGSADNNSLYGGEGNDLINGGFGVDKMDGGEGIDTLDVTFWGETYELNMNTGVTNYAGETAINFENVNTGSGKDTITGTKDNNIIDTGAGNDVILGGQRGNHAEIDRLTGGSGSDKFLLGDYHNNLYSVAGDDDYALITDFEKGKDTVQLDLESYTLGTSPIDNISGTAIYMGKELIGILQGVNQDKFVFEEAGFTMNLKA